jgi:hypothetical protein
VALRLASKGAQGRLRIRAPGGLLRHRHTDTYDKCRRARAWGSAEAGDRPAGVPHRIPNKSASAAAIPTKTPVQNGITGVASRVYLTYQAR